MIVVLFETEMADHDVLTTLKILIIGESSVGKSRYVEKSIVMHDIKTTTPFKAYFYFHLVYFSGSYTIDLMMIWD